MGTRTDTKKQEWVGWIKTYWLNCLGALGLIIALYVIFSSAPGSKPKRVYYVGGSNAPERRGDVVFVHGLDGNYSTTWGNPKEKFYWPLWLSQQSKDIGIWSLDYDGAASDWLGGSMPVEDRATNLLAEMRAQGIGKRPVIFVCHSLGGILAKQMLLDGATMNNPEYEEISSQTKGIAFLATPHSGSSAADLVNMSRLLLRKTVLIEQLGKDVSMLRQLNGWYRNNVGPLEVETLVLFETKDMSGIGRIVSESSSDPGITGVFPIPVDADHLSICKPMSAEDLVAKRVSEFIEKTLTPSATPSSMTLPELLSEYESVRESEASLEGFRQTHQVHRFTWDVFVRDVYPQDEDDIKSRSAYQVSETMAANAPQWVLARFPRNDPSYDKSLRKGTRIRISGILSKQTNGDELVLRDCKLENRLPTTK